MKNAGQAVVSVEESMREAGIGEKERMAMINSSIELQQDLLNQFNSRFDRIEEKLYERFDRMEEKTNGRFDRMEEKTNGRFDRMEEKFKLQLNPIEEKVSNLVTEVKTIDTRLWKVQIMVGALIIPTGYLAYHLFIK